MNPNINLSYRGLSGRESTLFTAHKEVYRILGLYGNTTT